MGGWGDNHPRMLGDPLARQNLGGLAQVIDLAVGARADKHLVDLHPLHLCHREDITGEKGLGDQGLSADASQR